MRWIAVLGAGALWHSLAVAQTPGSGPEPDSSSGGAEPPRSGICFVARRDSAADIDRMVAATEAATGTRFTLDRRNCVVATSIEPAGARWERVSSAFRAMAGEGVFRVDIAFIEGAGGGDTRGEPGRGIVIDPRVAGTPYGINPTAQGSCTPSERALWSLSQIIAHELGHAFATYSQMSDGANDDEAMRWEYAAGDRERPRKPRRPAPCHRR